MDFVRMVELYSISPEGFGGATEYRDKILVKVANENEYDERIEREKTKFALKYKVDRRLVQFVSYKVA